MTAAMFGRRFGRVFASLSVLGLALAPVAVAGAAPGPATTTAHKTVEVWRLHPNKAAARAPQLRLKLAIAGNGDGGALMVVEDRHSSFDVATGTSFAYAELAN